MTFADFVKDLQRELKENPQWANKKLKFATIDRCDLEYLSIYDAEGSKEVYIDVGTDDDNKKHNKQVVKAIGSNF